MPIWDDIQPRHCYWCGTRPFIDPVGIFRTKYTNQKVGLELSNDEAAEEIAAKLGIYSETALSKHAEQIHHINSSAALVTVSGSGAAGGGAGSKDPLKDKYFKIKEILRLGENTGISPLRKYTEILGLPEMEVEKNVVKTAVKKLRVELHSDKLLDFMRDEADQAVQLIVEAGDYFLNAKKNS